MPQNEERCPTAPVRTLQSTETLTFYICFANENMMKRTQIEIGCFNKTKEIFIRYGCTNDPNSKFMFSMGLIQISTVNKTGPKSWVPLLP